MSLLRIYCDVVCLHHHHKCTVGKWQAQHQYTTIRSTYSLKERISSPLALLTVIDSARSNAIFQRLRGILLLL